MGKFYPFYSIAAIQVTETVDFLQGLSTTIPLIIQGVIGILTVVKLYKDIKKPKK